MTVQDKNNQAREHKFPLRMFASAAIISCFMFAVISTVYTQAYAPCVHHFASKDTVVVNTNNADHAQTNTEQSVALCNRNNQQITWLTWLFKQSDSVEFHYLDLLELLSRK